ncbi:MAG: plasmid replication protein RepC, partial [Pararhodobacter sp.]
MQHILSTPVLRHVRRPDAHSRNEPAQPVSRQSKDLRWLLLDLVRECRHRLSLRDRDVTVLRGLLSLMPAQAGPHQRIVFASNRVLTERCDGIDERTLRRRIAHLQSKGLLTRKSSPNGKRYQIRDEHQDARLTYGIDLSPLFLIEPHLAALAEDCRREALRISALKAQIRDFLYRFPEAAAEDLRDEARLALRRSLSGAQLQGLVSRLAETLPMEPLPASTDAPDETSVLSARNGQNDRHILRSDKEYYESESSERALCRRTPATSKAEDDQDISIAECLALAPTASALAPALPRCWEEVIALTRNLAPAIGLKRSSIQQAEERLGAHGCALAVLGLVEAFNRIRNPEAYLRS